MAGAPIGNNNYLQGKLWNAAIKRALDKRSRAAGIEALDELAEKLLALADEGELGALKEIGDRLDGRPAQSIEMDAKVGVYGLTDVLASISAKDDQALEG